MALLTREQILAAKDFGGEVVEVPEWGGEVRVGIMNGTARDQWDDYILGLRKNGQDQENRRALVVASCLIDEDGRPMFTPLDVEALGRANAKALDRVIEAFYRVNGLRADDVEAAKGN